MDCLKMIDFDSLMVGVHQGGPRQSIISILNHLFCPFGGTIYDSNNALMDSNNNNYMLQLSLNENSNLKLYSNKSCSIEIDPATTSKSLNSGITTFYVKSASDITSAVTAEFSLTNPSLTTNINIKTTSSTTNSEGFIANWIGETAGGDSTTVSLANITAQNNNTATHGGYICIGNFAAVAFVCSYSASGTCDPGDGNTLSAPCLTC